MKLTKILAIALLVVIVCTAFVGCRRKDDNESSSSGLMSDVNSAISSVVSDVQSGANSIMEPNTSDMSTSDLSSK